MERLQEAEESLFVAACGRQAEGVKQSLPAWSLPRASRDNEKRVYISKKHPQDLLGKDSPGFAYTPQRQRHLPSWGFGTASQRPAAAKAKFPDASNDLLGTLPDNQQFKFGTKMVAMPRGSRDASYSAPDFDGFPAGEISPGPQRYNPSTKVHGHRLAHAPDVDKTAPSFTMRPMTKPPVVESQTPAKVGPGSYPVQEACRPQAKSEKPSLPHWSVNKSDRFKSKSQSDPGRLWDGMGDKARQFNRTASCAPSFSFGASTREHAKKVTPARNSLDMGPAAKMDKSRQSHPSLPRRHEVMKYSQVPAA